MNEPTETKVESTISEKVEVDKVELKTIEVRLNGIKYATQRSRFVFLIMTLMCATILASLWNSMLAWDREMAFDQSKPSVSGATEEQKTVAPTDADKRPDSRVSENQNTVATEWLRNLNFSIGLLGIRIGPNDLAVIGSVSLIVVMFWFFFSQRRENRAIVGLMRYCKAGYQKKQLNMQVCNMVFEGIVQSIIFIDMGGGDEPIQGLETGAGKPKPNWFIRRIILGGLTYLPPITIALIIAADIISLSIPSYLRESPEPLWKELFDGNHNVQAFKVVGFESVAIWACYYTRKLCAKCRKFSGATSRTIKDYNAIGLSGH